MKINKIILAAFSVAILTSACKKDETNNNEGLSDAAVVAYVANSGSFTNNNSSIAAIQADGTIANDLYFNANRVTPGDVLQSLAVTDKYIILAVNNSQKVEIIDRNTFKSVKVLDGLSDYPRYVVVNGDKAYVSNGAFAGTILTINLNTLAWEGTGIAVGNGPERIAVQGDKLLVTNSGGFTSDSTLSIVNLTTGIVEKTVELSVKPIDLVTNGTKTWVLCSGKAIYGANYPEADDHISAKLFELDANYNVIAEYAFADSTIHPNHLEISPDKTTLYTDIGSTVAKSSTSTIAWTTLATFTGSVYSIDVNTSNGDIYVCNPPSFTESGFVHALDANGTTKATYSTNIGPTGVYFPK